MDSNTLRLLNSIEEYLEINGERMHPFIKDDLSSKLSELATELRSDSAWGDEASPGEKAVQAASGPTADAVTFKEGQESMTPGERALAASQGLD